MRNNGVYGMENCSEIKITDGAIVYLADFSQTEPLGTVFPKQRNDEIADCKNPALQRQKYFVWQLLDYALRRTLGKGIAEVKPYKDEKGVWRSDDICFSLSHGKNLIAVAVSAYPVGVDVELIDEARFTDKLAERILVGYEKDLYEQFDGATTKYAGSPYEETPQFQKAEFLAKRWTLKESIFKQTQCQAPFWKINTVEYFGKITHTSAVTVVNGERYAYSVACEKGLGIQIRFKYSK